MAATLVLIGFMLGAPVWVAVGYFLGGWAKACEESA